MHSTKLWDGMAHSILNTSNPATIHPSAEDNILIAHPVIWNIIRSNFTDTQDLNVLDFGTGTGGFAKELADNGCRLIGTDTSRAMIAMAKKREIPGATFISGGLSHIPKKSCYDLIVSIMVFQFIRNAATMISRLYKHLNDNGLLIIAVHNRKYIEECLLRDYKFRRTGEDQQLHIEFENAAMISIYDRTAADYQSIFEDQLGMQPCAIVEPPFSPEYIRKYAKNSNEPMHVPKFLILGYKKIKR